MEFINYWSPADIALSNINGTNMLTFNSEAFTVCQAYIKSSARIEADFVFNGLDFGIIMKYNDNSGFILFSSNGAQASISKALYMPEQDSFFISVLKSVPVLVHTGNEITIACEFTPYNYKLFLGTQFLFSHNISDTSFGSGYPGIYSKSGNYCKAFRIYADIPLYWNFSDPSVEYIGRS